MRSGNCQNQFTVMKNVRMAQVTLKLCYGIKMLSKVLLLKVGLGPLVGLPEVANPNTVQNVTVAASYFHLMAAPSVQQQPRIGSSIGQHSGGGGGRGFRVTAREPKSSSKQPRFAAAE
jgi:hypothetical protein